MNHQLMQHLARHRQPTMEEQFKVFSLIHPSVTQEQFEADRQKFEETTRKQVNQLLG